MQQRQPAQQAVEEQKRVKAQHDVSERLLSQKERELILPPGSSRLLAKTRFSTGPRQPSTTGRRLRSTELGRSIVVLEIP